MKLQEDIATIVAEEELLTHSHTGAVHIQEETSVSGPHHHDGFGMSGNVTPSLGTSHCQQRGRAFRKKGQHRLPRLVTFSIVSRPSLSDRTTFRSIC